MIGFILLIILVIASWTLLGLGTKNDSDWQVIVGLISGLILTSLLMGASIYLAGRSSDAESFKRNRDYNEELVNNISDNMSPATIARIISVAEATNSRIEDNKGRCDSEMWGFMYNKGIAETEPIDIPKYKFSVEIEE